MKIVLASQSPRRKEYLEKMGVEFDVLPATKDEIINPELTYSQVAIDLSKQKALEVFEKTKHLGNRLVIGSDTTVVYQGEIMGKPKDIQDARRMLEKLRASQHEVFTGLFVIIEKNGKIIEYSAADQVGVWFKNYSSELVEKYLKTGEPIGKAGAYMMQGIGGNFVEKINGHPASVIGLPVPRLYEIFEKENISFLNF
jgi:septum formation protein